MLKIVVPETRRWDQINERFVYTRETVLTLEHSLVSLEKWEEKWHKCFLSKNYEKTDEEIIDYIRCMTITQNVDPNVYYAITLNKDIIATIINYISSQRTATLFFNPFEENKKQENGELLTAEVIYYYMIKFGIPIDKFEKKHLSKLFALLKTFEIKDTPPKKMSESELRAQHASINERNKRLFNTKG